MTTTTHPSTTSGERPLDPPAPAIAVAALEFSYVKGAAPFLRCPHLQIPAQTLTWLSGRSGCGKSTLLRIIAGIERANRGSVVVDGRDLTRASAKDRSDLRAHLMGVVFQEHDLIDGLTVRENVQFAARLAGTRMSDAEATGVLDVVGVADLAGRMGVEISGGQRQRASIARALAKRPRYLLMDEPTSALDESNSQRLFELLLSLRGEGVTSLVVSHDSMIERYADGRVLVVDGQVGTYERLAGR